MIVSARRSFQQTKMDIKIMARHRAIASQAIPSRAATDYIFGSHHDIDEPEFIEARQIISLNQRYE
jgi:hypothetical protein